MPYYKTCEHCGANLDPGERCTCKDQKCVICDERLKWGKFAMNQNICWNCFKENVKRIIAKMTPDDAVWFNHAMAGYAELHGEKW